MGNCYLAGAKRFIILFNKNLLCSTICQTQDCEQNKQGYICGAYYEGFSPFQKQGKETKACKTNKEKKRNNKKEFIDTSER